MSETSKRCVVLGIITGVHGVKGQVKVKSFTRDPEAIADYGLLQAGDTGRVLEIAHMQAHKDIFLVEFAGVLSREDAENLKGLELKVDREKLPDAEADEYYFSDLVGLSVKNQKGQTIGKVIEMVNFGGGDLLEIGFDGHKKSELLAFNNDSVPVVDIAAGYVVVVPPDWMFEEKEDQP